MCLSIWTPSSFIHLVAGGEIEYEGERFTVDKSVTNPEGVSAIRYFREDKAHRLNGTAKAKLPENYLKRISQFERYPSVTARLESWLEDNHEESIETIACTHEGLTGKLIERVTDNKDAFLQRGRYVEVANSNGLWIPINVHYDTIGYDS